MATVAMAYKYGTVVLPRWDAEVPVAMDGKVQFFPIRALCKVLGISSQTQMTVIQNDSRFSAPDVLREIPQKTGAGWREATWIRRQECALWLTNIDPARCSITARGPLAEFQADLMREADALMFGGKSRSKLAERGKVTVTSHQVIHMNCLDCGLPHRLVIENGVPVEIERDTGQDDEDD